MQNRLVTGLTAGILCCASCTMLCAGQLEQEMMSGNSGETAKPELVAGNTGSVAEVPFSKVTAGSMPLVSDAKVETIHQTVSGLKEAGYSLDEIVGVLKSDQKQAPQISIALLKQGYNGTKIYQSLLKAGFSERSAQAAVPPALRTREQPFVVYDGTDPDSVNAETAMITPNPFSKGTLATKQTDMSAVPVSQIAVPVSVGVTFNGLANWGEIQNNRFNADRR